MKVLQLIFFIIFAHTFCITAGFFYVGNERSLNHLTKPVMKALENKCLTAENPKQFEHAFDELVHCIDDSMQESPAPFDPPFDLSNYDQDHCSYLNESQLRLCVNKFTWNILPCLAENEVYIRQFLLNAFDNVYEELCGANTVSNKEYIYDKVNRTGECIELCGFILYAYGSCNASNLNIFKHLDKGVLSLNKHDVCSDLESLHKCTTQLADAICNEEYSRLTDLIFHPFLKNCNDLDARK